MEPTTTSHGFFIAGAIFFALAVYAGVMYSILEIVMGRGTPPIDNAKLRLDDVELTVRNIERAQIELPSDRQLSESAASPENGDAV